MVDYVVHEMTPFQREVGLDSPGRLSLAFENTEHTFPQNTAGLVIGIGNPNTTPPMLVIPDHNIIYCPTGFSYWDGRWLRNVGNFVQASTFGRESYSPLTTAQGIDPFISGKHLKIKKGENGQITVRNMGRNGTSVAEVPMMKGMEGGRFYLRRGAVALDASIERRITLTVGRNTVELIIGPDGVKRIIGNKVVVLLEIKPLNKALSFLGMNPQENNLQRLILGRNNINPTDEEISPFHISIIWDPTKKRYYLFDHSNTGTTVEFAERQPQPQVKKEREGKIRTPKLILKKAHHKKQQILGDPNSVGGDYYLFGSQLGKSPDLLEKGGDAVVVMDTASIQTGGETPATTTRPFAYAFLTKYYNLIADGKDPETAMEEAYRETYYSYGGLGQRTEATFTFVTVVGDTAYCLWVGNTEAVVVKKDGSVNNLASSEGMVGEPYYDSELNRRISPTLLVASRVYQTSKYELSRGDRVYVHTDGVLKLNPKNPKFSLLDPDDDAVLVRL